MHLRAPDELNAFITTHLKDVALRSYPDAEMHAFLLQMYVAGAASAYENAVNWLEDIQNGARSVQQAKEEAEVRLAATADKLFDTLLMRRETSLDSRPGK